VSASYDPLLGKIICWGVDRAEALMRLDAALGETMVLGVPSTAGFLRRVVSTPEFRAGGIDTGFLAAHPRLPAPEPPPSGVLAAAARASLAGPAPWRALAGWRQGGPRTKVRLEVGGTWQAVAPAAAGWSEPGATPPVTCPVLAEDGRPGVEVAFGGSRWQLWLDVPVAPPVDPQRLALSEGADSRAAIQERPSRPERWFVVAPLSGKAGKRMVEEGAAVDANAPVTSIEAMKMQHAIVAAQPGRVVRWLVEPGAFVRAGQPMVEMAPVAQDSGV
jgi:acetyl-CoA/propionyl-CoA carboxylase biotin carboxyl carrier protein